MNTACWSHSCVRFVTQLSDLLGFRVTPLGKRSSFFKVGLSLNYPCEDLAGHCARASSVAAWFILTIVRVLPAPLEILVHLVSSTALDLSSISTPRKGHYFIRTDFTHLIGMDYIGCTLCFTPSIFTSVTFSNVFIQFRAVPGWLAIARNSVCIRLRQVLQLCS